MQLAFARHYLNGLQIWRHGGAGLRIKITRENDFMVTGSHWRFFLFQVRASLLSCFPVFLNPSLKIENFEFFHWDEPEGPRTLHHPWVSFPWVGVHRKCFDMMRRLVEYRTNVMRLTPDDTILRTGKKSPRVPTSLGEMYEVYQSRIHDNWGASLMSKNNKPLWKVLEPHRYYYNGQYHDDKHVNLFGNIYWPWGSRYTIVCVL